jgi:prepilin-type N-terminal cleavage/methylation domain-containing protein
MIKNFVKTDQPDTTSCRDPIQAVSCRGFTLLELSIVLIITGILTIPLIRLYTDYLQQEKIDLTKSNLDHISRIVALSSPLRYPCPADRSLIPSDPNYGLDVCTLPGFSLNAIPVCDVTGAEQGTL